MAVTEENRPDWAGRLRREREARRWTQADAVAAMRTFANQPLPDGLLDQWKRWERGRNKPDEFYRPLIASVFGTVVDSIFPAARPAVPALRGDALLLSRSGMDTHELVQRIRQTSVNDATLDALKLTVEQLCCEYASRDAGGLIKESREWLETITKLLDQRLSFVQHRDVLDSAGWLTLLIGCLEYDTGQSTVAEATRTAAMQLGNESGNVNVMGWSHEMRSWFAITKGRYSEVIAAAQAGQDVAPGRSVAVQLYAQEAKAWARMGNKRNVVHALERGRMLLDTIPYPERPDNHFVVDPEKFDFYAMDCYRLIGDDELAEMHAHEIIRKTTGSDGAPLSPMRQAEALITLGVVAARNGDITNAIDYGNSAIGITRRSMPSLRLVGHELASILDKQYPASPTVRDFQMALNVATGDS